MAAQHRGPSASVIPTSPRPWAERDAFPEDIPRACGMGAPGHTRGWGGVGGWFCLLWEISEAVSAVGRVSWLQCGHGGQCWGFSERGNGEGGGANSTIHRGGGGQEGLGLGLGQRRVLGARWRSSGGSPGWQ